MDRRRFLEAGATSAASLLAASACAPAMRLTERRSTEPPADMEGYLARIDAGMERLGRWSSADYAPLLTARTPELDSIGRAALQSLFITGMVGDLPVPAQLHPGVQERMDRAMPILDAASDSMTGFLRSRDASDLATVQAALRDYGAGPRIIERLDEEAAALGLSAARREQTRSIYAHAEWRLRNQPPGLLVSEYLDKVDRLTAGDLRAEAAAQSLGARAAEEAFWASEPGRRERRITRGARTMGWGVLIFGVGGGIVAAGAFPGVFLMTAGVVTFLVGLIILLVGAATPGEPAADSAAVRTR